MKILGLNIGIGPSIFLMENGVPFFAVEEERLVREKNFMEFPSQYLDYLKENHTDFIKNLDHVSIAGVSDFDLFSRKQFHAQYDLESRSEKSAPLSLRAKIALE